LDLQYWLAFPKNIEFYECDRKKIMYGIVPDLTPAPYFSIKPCGYRGLYIGKYPPPLGGREYQPMPFGGKNMKRPREKGGKCRRKRRKGKETGRKGKENEKRGSKRVK
jgi:hypothetical protein